MTKVRKQRIFFDKLCDNDWNFCFAVTTRRPLKRPPVYKKQDDRKNSPVESSTTNAVESSSPEIAEEDTK